MVELSVVPQEERRIVETDSFGQVIWKDLGALRLTIAPEAVKVRQAAKNVKRIKDSIAELEQTITRKEQEAANLRDLAAEAALNGEDVNEKITRRATLLGEIQTIKDLAEDMRRQIPVAERSALGVARVGNDVISAELVKLRDEHQKEIEARAQEIVDMIKAYQLSVNEFIGETCPEFFNSGKQVPLLYIPDLHRIMQLAG